SVVSRRNGPEGASTAAMMPPRGAAPVPAAPQAAGSAGPATEAATVATGAAEPGAADPAPRAAPAARTGGGAGQCGPARLAIDVEHGLKTGRLRVWLDEKQVVSEEVESRVTSKLLG